MSATGPHEEGASTPFPTLLPWQENAARDALSRKATWPHALLLHGRPGIGKHVLALVFARSLLCESPAASGLACGACAGCLYVAAGQHPDLRLVEPNEFDDDGTVTSRVDIPIDAIRRLTEFTQVTSHRRVAKVAVVTPAERMNGAAANALLKTLEEPPPRTFLMLVSHQPGRLPATVRSRCRGMDAPVPTAAQAREWLLGAGVADPDPLLAQAGGAPLAALALADRSVQAERAAWLAWFAKPDALSPFALGARIDAAPRDERKDRLAGMVQWLIGWTADLARVASGGTVRHNPDFARDLAALAPRVAPVPLLRYHRDLLRQRLLVSHPLQPRLVAEALLIDYRALFR